MIRPITCVLTTLLTFSLCSKVAVADDLRCNGWIIDAGDTETDAQAKCGKPGYQTTSEQEEVIPLRNGGEKIIYHAIDAWLYDLDDGSFMRSVTFVDGSVRQIESLRLRGRLGPRKGGSCFSQGPAIEINDPADLVGYLCGEPQRRRIANDEIVVAPPRNRGRRTVRTEIWIYAAPGGERRIAVTGGRVVSMSP